MTRHEIRPRRNAATLLAIACALLATPLGALAQVSPALERAIAAPFLSDEERRQMRIEHGLWTGADLRTPADVALAALASSAYDHPALSDPSVPARLRAEAMIARGELDEAVELLDPIDTISARRLLADAHALAGRTAIATEICDEVARLLASRRITDASELAEGVRALLLRQRLRGPGAVGDDARAAVQSDYNAMLRLLAGARDELDRLNWRVRLVEAELLYDKQRLQAASDAAGEALALNPRCARAMWIRGRIAVDAFSLDQARSVADDLDRLNSTVPRGIAGSSVYGADIRARAALRRGDEDLAEQALDDTLARFPLRRESLALACAVSAVGFDYARTDAMLDAFDELSPGSPLALLDAGAALSEARQYEQSAVYLQRAVELAPNWAKPHLELGLMEMQSGRDARAAIALGRAVELDPFNVRADNSLKLINELQSYAIAQSDNFIVRARPGVDAAIAREMLPVLERIHERIAGAADGGIDHTPGRPTVVELMPDHQWFSVRITGMPQIHTIAAATGPVIAMEAPREGPGQSIGPYDWARVLQHEYVHTVTLSRTNNRIPHWFTEASAVYLEDAPFPSDWMPLLASAFTSDRLFTLDRIDLGFIRPEQPSDRTLAYAQSAWMYAFMIDEWGDRAPLDLMDLFAEGVSQRDAIMQVLGVPEQAFFAQFLERARADLLAWGMILPEGVPTLNALLRGLNPDLEDGEDLPPPTIAQLEDLLETYPGHPEILGAAAALVSQGVTELDARGVDLNSRLAIARPQDPAPRRRLVRHALAVGDPALAEQHLEWLDIREIRTAAYAAELARIYRASGRTEEAKAKIERATMIAPYDAQLRETAARDALLRRDYETAQRHITMLTILEPDVELHRRRLDALLAMRDQTP